MALSTTITRALYTGNGSNTTFAIPGTIIQSDSDEVSVYKLALDGTVSLLVEGALQDYTLTGASPPSTPFDTDVEMNSAPANGVKILVIRILAITQGIHVNSNSEIIAATTQERGYDRLTAICQQLQEQINRAIKLNITSSDTNIEIETPLEDYVLVGDVDGNIVNGLKTETIQAAIDAAISAEEDAALAALSAAQAAASAASAAASAAAALVSENNAETAETNAETAEVNAEAAQAAAEVAQAAAEAAAAALGVPAPANTVLAGPISGAAASPTMRALIGDDLPNPAPTTKGGVKSLAAASNQFLTSIGTNGTPTQAQPSFSNISGSVAGAQLPGLTGDITAAAGSIATVYAGTVPINKGGTGQTTKALAFDALSPMTTSGDIIYGGASGTGTRLAKGSNGQVLTLASGIPLWASAGTGDVVGPGSSTDNAIARFDTTTGKLIQNSGVTIDDTGHLLGVAGSASTPSFSFIADPDTGIYNTANTLLFSTGGTARMNISSAGINLVKQLNLSGAGSFIYNTSGSAGFPSYSFVSDNNSGMYLEGSSILALATTGSDRIVIHDDVTHITNDLQVEGHSGLGGPPSTEYVLYSQNGFSTFVYDTVTLPTQDDTNGGLAISTNKSSTDKEVNFWNISQGEGTAFQFTRLPALFGTPLDLLTMLGNGFVGIGTTTPSVWLTVAGLRYNDGGEIGYQQTINDSYSAYDEAPQAGLAFFTKYLSGSNDQTFRSGIWGGKENTTDGDNAGYLAFATVSNGDSSRERMRIDSIGAIVIKPTSHSATPSTPVGAVALWAAATTTSQTNLYSLNENGKSEQITGLADRVSTQFDKTNTTLADITGLSHYVEAGKAYAFEAKLYTSSNIAGGVKAAIGGTATATSVIYEGLTTAAGSTTQTRATALGTAVGGVTAVTAAFIYIHGTIVVSSGGTLTVQFAENAAVLTSSVLVGSTFILKPVGD